jgi:predicted SAM-dependent methyltransferase
MIKIHAGCGKRDFGSGWFNIDMANFPHIHHQDIGKLPFPDNSVDLIYSAHTIEYFDRQEVIPLLLEWKRSLKPGGIMRLAVPNFCMLAKLYMDGKYPLKNLLGPMYGRMDVGNKLIYHKTVYDCVDLMELLSSIGMKNLRRYNWQDTEHAQFDDHSQAYLPHMDKINGVCISLNVEAEK